MARESTGSVRWRGESWTARITIARGVRRSFTLSTCAEHQAEKAEQRAALLARLAKRLRAAGHTELTPRILERAAARDGQALEDVVGAVDRLCSGEAAPPVDARITFQQFAEQWTSGELHRRWPDHVRFKASAKDDAQRLALHVYPHVGDVPLCEFSLEHADRVMSQLPARLSGASRRHVAQCIARVLKLAAYPARLIPASPIPPGFLPPVGPRKALSFLYPDEDRQLLGCTSVPLPYRILYGVLNREGMRRGEAAGLAVGDLDLERGALALDHNKTDDPRAWAMRADVVRALRLWLSTRGELAPDDLVFVDETGASTALRGDYRECKRLRAHLKEAGVTRPELFEKSTTRQPIRMHDLRATFVTLSLANGKTETWVADRTGHTSSAMINRYRRAARQVSELGLGDLAPMDEAIPELRALAQADKSASTERDREKDHAVPGTETETAPEGAVVQGNRADAVDGSWRTRTSSQRIKSPSGAPRHVGSSAFLGGQGASEGTDRDGAVPFSAPSVPLDGPSEPLRAKAIRVLGALAGELGAAGDVHAARVLHEAFSRLIGAEAPEGAEVLDLAAHRRGESS